MDVDVAHQAESTQEKWGARLGRRTRLIHGEIRAFPRVSASGGHRRWHAHPRSRSLEVQPTRKRLLMDLRSLQRQSPRLHCSTQLEIRQCLSQHAIHLCEALRRASLRKQLLALNEIEIDQSADRERHACRIVR